MVLLRRVIGDALRARRQGQHRTLREVSTAANVSLGYLSEIERGQKEPSSELLAAICDALGARLSELLREVSDTVALAEQMPGVLVPVQDEPVEAAPVGAAAAVRKATNRGRPPGHLRRHGRRVGPPGLAAQGDAAQHPGPPTTRPGRGLRRLTAAARPWRAGPGPRRVRTAGAAGVARPPRYGCRAGVRLGRWKPRRAVAGRSSPARPSAERRY